MFDALKTTRRLKSKLTEYFDAAGIDNAVVGLSGGLDSSTVAYLATDALGEHRVFGILLPARHTSARDILHALQVARSLGIEHYTFNISDIAHSISARIHGPGLHPQNNLTNGNIAARLRSIFLYNVAARKRALVLGTGDRSELLLGYFTKYGDGACDLLPIGSIYKSDVKDMARSLRVPHEIINKPPSPSLWHGHTAESELGASYEKIDEVLRLLFERRMKPSAVAKKVQNLHLVNRILLMHARSVHKRAVPPIL